MSAPSASFESLTAWLSNVAVTDFRNLDERSWCEQMRAVVADANKVSFDLFARPVFLVDGAPRCFLASSLATLAPLSRSSKRG